MEYSIRKLAKLAGVSPRTLRYYEELGLLSPKRISNGYRVYGQKEVDRLQQILFYRELGLPLEQIEKILSSKDYDAAGALNSHLLALKARKKQIEALIATVEKTILASKGEISMSDQEKFEGFKKELLAENEQNYGEEIRSKYGEEAVAKSNAKFMGLTAEEYEETQKLSREIMDTLKAAFLQGNPGGELAQKACALHQKWLSYFWPSYSGEAHLGLAQMYVDDPRFTDYYDAIAPGCTRFLRDAIEIYVKR